MIPITSCLTASPNRLGPLYSGFVVAEGLQAIEM